jgi:alpha-L-fucosidase
MKELLLLGPLIVGYARIAPAQEDYRPTPENLAARSWFQDAKFGMFIHWGIYSLLQDGEWVMHNRGITTAEYESLAPQFNPVKFDPAAWVALAKAAGMRYITFTSKHHDGFAMFDSRVSDWDVVERTRRPAAACRRGAEAGDPGLRLSLPARLASPRLLPTGRNGRPRGTA